MCECGPLDLKYEVDWFTIRRTFLHNLRRSGFADKPMMKSAGKDTEYFPALRQR